MNKREQLTQVMSDEAFATHARECTTVEELQGLFNEYGVDMTEEETAELCHQVADAVESGADMSAELTEESLDNVSGGFAWIPIAVGVWCVGCVAVGLWNGYQSCKKR